MNIAVIGDGGWGSAVARLLDAKGHAVTVWGPFGDYIAEVRATRQNPRYLPGVDFPETIRWTADLAEAVPAADVLVLAIPSKFYRAVCARVAPLLDAPRTLVVSLTKGVCPETRQRMSEVAKAILGTDRVVVLSGPSHAEEVARGIPTAVTCACQDHSASRSAASSRTSSPSPSAPATASASATTPAPPSSPAASPR